MLKTTQVAADPMTGEYAFRCYRNAWLALHPGQPIIEWENVEPRIQECWNSTVQAIVNSTLRSKANAHAKILHLQSEANDYSAVVSELRWQIASLKKELADAKSKANFADRPFRKTSRCGSVESIRFPKLHHASAEEIFQSSGTLMDEPAHLAIENEEDRQSLESLFERVEPAEPIKVGGAFYGRRKPLIPTAP